MTPLSITLQNFLCYSAQEDGSPYVFNFREHRLWSICGDNGAGKSAIFDAITYCLYGEHRGGESRDEELVHRGTSNLLACVEFEHGGREYRVTRTIRLGVLPRKGTPTVRRDCHMEWLREDGEWVEVAETSSTRGLEEAVRQILGYGCDTLTASVLLLQGKSDRLIEVASKDRFGILSGILDLSRYERLEERAKDKAREARTRQQDLVRALEQALPQGEGEVEAAELAALDAEREAESAAAARAAAERTLMAATEFWARNGRLTTLRSEEAEMVEALKEAPTITAEAAERETLARTLPQLRTALEAEREATSAETEAEAARKAAGEVDVSGAEKALEGAEAAHTESRRQHREVAKQISDANAELELIAPDVTAAKELGRLEGQIEKTSNEVAELQAKCAGVEEVRTRVERLRKLASATSLIASYRKARESLARAAESADDGDPEAELERRRVRREQAEAGAEAAAAAESQAGRGLARAEVELREAEKTLADREEAGTEGTCSHCGQKVPPAHIKVQVADARKASTAAQKLHADALREVAEATERRQAADTAVKLAKAAETGSSEFVRRAGEARATISELAASDEFAELPEDLRQLLAAPLPDLLIGIDDMRGEQRELTSLAAQLGALESASAEATAKSNLLNGWERDRTTILKASSKERLAAALARDGLLRDELRTLQTQEQKLGAAEDAAAAGLRSAEGELTTLRAQRQLQEETARLCAQAARGHHQAAKAALTGVASQFLPVTAAIADGAEERLAQLQGAAERLVTLRKAESGLDSLRGQIRELQGHVDATSEAVRVPVEDAKVAVTSAIDLARHLQAEAKVQRRAADAITRTRDERLKRQAEAESLAMTRAVWDRVGQLLGRSGIQTALMRSALEDIQERANTMLSRISGGQLQLTIACEPIPKGMEIYIRCLDASSSEQPLDVQFLSGGQRFRCAVALAAGIGQRAGSEGSMPSQIIDEGFGSLDTEGRREMLEEIRQMSEFYERVIVISHMESFHDQALFPARYELRKDGMRTVVTASP